MNASLDAAILINQSVGGVSFIPIFWTP